jgi:putative ABC transport system ATP-binding protein
MAAAVSVIDRGAPRDEREALIELVGVSKDYDSGAGVVRAMREVNLLIHHGEFVAIVGTSGSGKSTMMNILGCLDRPTRGKYTLAGIDAGGRGNDSRALVRNRLIGFIFQGFNLLPRTTATENVELPLQYRGVGSRARRKKALAVLEQVGLGERGHHKPNELSGGQQQRVAIARALVTDPPLLLADEPTGNLDTRTSLEVLALLQKLNRESGITIVLVTHEHDIAACASRVITMRDGRIVSDVMQDKPTDAAEELAALPPPQEYAAVADGEGDPAEAARVRVGGPVPIGVYFMGLLGAALGALVGAIYCSAILRQMVGPIVLATALVGEGLLAARYARKKLGRPMTSDQRARVAIWGTIALVLVVAAFAILRSTLSPGSFAPLFAMIQGFATAAWRVPVALVAGVATLSLLRYLLLTLFNPRK